MKLIFPIKELKIGQEFGRDATGDPVYGKFYEVFGNRHPGVDFLVPVGTEVVASWPGEVVRCEFHAGMGKVIGVKWGDFMILYAHLSEFGVKMGEKIKQGQLIGLSGQTGAASPIPHLHLEMRDLRRENLKDQVFEPPFGKDLGSLMG